MPKQDQSAGSRRLSRPLLLMMLLLILIWISGGASRADAAGQIFARGSAWLILIAMALSAARPPLRSVSLIAALVFASLLIAILQLIPLPPALWTALPGRKILEQAAVLSGKVQPWRPLSMSPGATVNALSSLIVPIATLLLAASLSRAEHARIASLLLALVVASTLLGMLQFAGGHFDHPLVNDIPGMVSASFANRNHFALFVAIGCSIAPAWAFGEEHRAAWKAPVALTLLLLFFLIILGTGSRSGIALAAMAGVLGLATVRRQLASKLRHLPKRLSLGLTILSAAALVIAITLSVMLGRAVSIDRAFKLEASDDLRRQALPTIWEMVKLYFPFGSGVGTFDPVYRISEHNELLSLAYLNHAHNDFLEVVLDAGILGLLVLVTAVVWWLWKSARVWRSPHPDHHLERVGSVILLLTLAASVTDYPARTPMIMAVVVIAAVWLNGSHPASAVSRRASRNDRIVSERKNGTYT